MNQRLTRAGTLTGITALHIAVLLGTANANHAVTPPEPLPIMMVDVAPTPVQTPAPPAPPAPQPPKPQAKAPVPKTPAPTPPVKAAAPRPERTITQPQQPVAPVATTASTAPVAPAAPAVAEAPPAPPAPPAAPAPVVQPTHIGSHLGNPKPQYPPLSIELGESGNVGLRVQISAEGRPLEVSLARSSGFARLDRAAIQAVKNWRFTPAKRGGEAIPFLYTFSVEFDLNKA